MQLTLKQRKELTSAAITHSLGLIMAVSGVFMLSSYAADPSWWSSPGTGSQPAVMAQQVVTNNGVVKTNFAPNPNAFVTQGQLKQFAARAVDELNAVLPSGAGPSLNTMVDNWALDYATSNYASPNNPYAPYKPTELTVMTVGQLKYVGNQVWSQLVAAGYTNAVPSWLSGTNAGDLHVAVLGQLKEVFNFDLSDYQNTVADLSATLNSDGSVTLSWLLPSGSNGNAIAIAGISADGTVTILDTVSDTTTSITVPAADFQGSSFLVASNASIFLPGSLMAAAVALPPPAPPTGLSAQLDTSGNMDLSWTAPTGTVTCYRIERENLAAATWSFLANTPNAATTYQDTNYGSGGFHYRVSTISATGTSTPSTEYPLSTYVVLGLPLSYPSHLSNGGQVLGEGVWSVGSLQGFTLTDAAWADPVGIDDQGNVAGNAFYSVWGGAYSAPAVWPFSLADTLLPLNFAASNGSPQQGVLAVDYNGTIYGSIIVDNSNGNAYDGVSWTGTAGPSELGHVRWGSSVQFGPCLTGTSKLVYQARNNFTIGFIMSWDAQGNLTDDSNAINGISIGTYALDGNPGPTPLEINTHGDYVAEGTVGGVFGEYIFPAAGGSEAVPANCYFIAFNGLSHPQILYQYSTAHASQTQLWQKNATTGTYTTVALCDAIFPTGNGPISAYIDINDSGMILAEDRFSSGYLLLPLKLVNLADPYLGSVVIGTPSHNNQDTPIDLSPSSGSTDINNVAWIAASDPNNVDPVSGVACPRMPNLQASIAAPPGTKVWWKLSVINHDRNQNPYRNFDTFENDFSLTQSQIAKLTNVNETGSITLTGYSDDIDIPMPSNSADGNIVVNGWIPVPAGQPWNIYQDPDWKNAFSRGFFGGDAELSLKITSNDGKTSIMPEQDFYFRIAGENPPATACKTYIQRISQGNWWAYAMAKAETHNNGGRPYYNQFLDDGALHQGPASNLPRPGHEGTPCWNNDGIPIPTNGTGGYGLFQLTYDKDDPTFIMPRDWIWNWQQNSLQAINEVKTCVTSATAYVNAQQAKATLNNQLIPIPKISLSRGKNPADGEPKNQPLNMTGGDSVYGYPLWATVSFYDNTTKPANLGELIEVAESIKNYNSGKGSHYVKWNGSKWIFTRGRPGDSLSYDDIVSFEIEAPESHAVAPPQ